MKLRRAAIERGLLPKEIYKGASYFVTELALFLSDQIRNELRILLSRLLKEAGVTEDGTFFRIDAYIDPEMRHLNIIEVNSHFVDGWGVALNLARAAGWRVALPTGVFPKFWTLTDNVYLPELELACQELELLAGEKHDVVFWGEALGLQQPVYWYGRFRREGFLQVVPKCGALLDDKIWLARVAREWSPNRVLVPKCYSVEETPWENLPTDVVLKVRRKWENERAKPVFRAELVSGKGTRKAYQRGELIAQEVVSTLHIDDRPIQAVIMCAGIEPVVGYIQHAHHKARFINDNSEHGPLLFGG